MSAQLKEFLKRVFSLRNIVPLIIIAVAFTGTFVPSPFGIQRDQILLALLAFLAIDSLLERIEMLSNIENDIKHVKLLAESQLSGKGMLRRRSDFPRVEHMIAEVKQELFITGITLDIMSTITGLFEQKAQQCVRIKFLGINPGGEIIEEISKYSGFEREELVARVKSNLNKIYRIAQRFPNSIELRVISHRLANGYFVADPNIDQGYMTVTPYFFKSRILSFLLCYIYQRKWMIIGIKST